jgi:translation elongation factor EF-Tu-like GTPase
MTFHLKVRDIFDIKGQGVVVLGTIESGAVSVGDRLLLVSGATKLPVIVASIEKFQEHSLDEASAGPDDVGIGLAQVTREQVHLHDLLVGAI